MFLKVCSEVCSWEGERGVKLYAIEIFWVGLGILLGSLIVNLDVFVDRFSKTIP